MVSGQNGSYSQAVYEDRFDNEFEFENEGIGLNEDRFDNEFEFEFENEGIGLNEDRFDNEFEFENEGIGLNEDRFDNEFEFENEGIGLNEDRFDNEFEFENEGEAFFGGLKKLMRRLPLKALVKIAGPMVAGAIGGPAAAAAAAAIASRLKESEFELEVNTEMEMEAFLNSPMTENEILAEHMANLAAKAASDHEAEALVGAATVAALSPRQLASLRRIVPYIIMGNLALLRYLRRNRNTRPLIRGTISNLPRLAARNLLNDMNTGIPLTRQSTAQAMARTTRQLLGNPQLTAAALRRNVIGNNQVRRSYPSTNRYAQRNPPRRYGY